ncbi:L-selectin-like [Pseudoliparis swirei]|uniref:L-selectin-like n=1 Tax=Pseudoliparis swirei TaxID=2059687 RepID=UPI0024BDF9B6|nr:L-selectin-like [Pseudoliparis swirei]
MKKTMLFVLTLSGLTAPSTSVMREYHYVKMLKTWTEAQSYCREKFTDLAAVENQSDNDSLLSVLQSLGDYAWIGLYDKTAGWKWALGDADFNNEYKKGPSKYILVEAPMTWDEARTYCRSRYTDLVSVRNQSENNQIKSLLTTKTWLGLHRKIWAYWNVVK